MKVRVKKWGHSASIRIPASMMRSTYLKLDEVVDMREENGRIIIEPLRTVEYTLDDLLKGITKENMHGEFDTGAAVGNEVW